MKYIFAGDSWALKGFTNDNYNIGNNDPMPDDVCLADHWGIEYQHCLTPGRGNLSILDQLIKMNVAEDVPIVWVYTEPGRDYGRITGNPEFDWIKSEDIFSIRKELDVTILKNIKQRIKNPVALIGGLSDIAVGMASELGYTVLCPSWQHWMAKHLDRTKYFDLGWGASDVGWRADYNNVTPGKAAVFAWDKLIKEWCMWEDLGYMCHEHPTPRANKEFAEYLKQDVIDWIDSVNK